MILKENNLYFLKQVTVEDLEAVSINLSPSLVLNAYPKGLFPWHEDQEYFYWFNPNPRMILDPKEVKVSKSMRNILNRNEFSITINKAFKEVIKNCSIIKRKNQDSTWISDAFLETYNNLHQSGHAHSIEVWKDTKLVGGLYGLKIGSVFFGESMFSLVSNASKVAFIYLAKSFENVSLIDCQAPNPHLESLGAKEISKDDFLKLLPQHLNT